MVSFPAETRATVAFSRPKSVLEEVLYCKDNTTVPGTGNCGTVYISVSREDSVVTKVDGESGVG